MESPAELKRAIVKLLNRVKEEIKREDPEFDFDVEFYLTQPGAEVEPDHQLVKSIQAAHKAVYRDDAANLYSAIDSDASVLTHFGIPAINYGPRPKDASTRTGGREYQNIQDVVDVAKVFALLALDVCNRPA
jgi:acetylornithine deacetylase/succinyl-diaminopimelate desuccinylase-like protein